MDYKAPKGTRDITGEISYKWHYLEEVIRDVCRVNGFSEIRTPIFEHTELFLRGVGDTTDVVQKEMYTFEDKGGRSITLRPEGTAGVVRSFIESGRAGGAQPTKLYYLSAPIFRYENPQAGRLREHHQFGVEMFGAKDASADAEVILLALNMFKKLGITKLSLNINSIGCPECRPEYNKKLVEYFTDKKSELCGTCHDRLEKNPLRLLDCKVEKCHNIAMDAPVIAENLCEECETHMQALKSYLEISQVEYSVNPHIVRGLDYYTKTVFEIISDEIGAQGTVCGGGRYDGLIKQLGGPVMPGVGFGLGVERLLMVLESAGIEIKQPERTKLFVCTMGDDTRVEAFKMLNELRAIGISCDMDHAKRSMKAQFKYADKIGAQYVLTIGESELQEGVAKLRDMNNSEERSVRLKDVVAELKGEA